MFGTCIIYQLNFHNIIQINVQHFVLLNIALWNIFNIFIVIKIYFKTSTVLFSKALKTFIWCSTLLVENIASIRFLYKILDQKEEGYRQSTGAAPPCSGPSLSGESWQVSVAGERIFSPPLQKTTTKDNVQSFRWSLSFWQYLFDKVRTILTVVIKIVSTIWQYLFLIISYIW